MFWYRLVFAVGSMTVAYIISATSLSLAKKLEHANKLKFLMNALIVIHYFSAIASLFVGLFMYYREEDVVALKKRIEDLENQLRDKSPKEGADTSDETYYYMEAANGMTVRVPESKLEEWTAQQEAIRNGATAPKLTEAESRLVDSIVRDLYGDPKDE